MTHTTKLFRFLPVLLLLSGVSLSGSVAVRAEPGQSGGVPDEEGNVRLKRPRRGAIELSKAAAAGIMGEAAG